MSEDPQGKWAVEAYDFLRLFRRVGRSFFGLALLILAWTAFMLLLQKLIGGSIHLPDLPLKWRWLFGGRVLITIPLNASTFYLAGVVLVALVWSFYSDFYQYPYAFALFILKPTVLALLFTFAAVLFLLNSVLLPISWSIERLSVWRWKQRNQKKLMEITDAVRKELTPKKEPADETQDSTKLESLVKGEADKKIVENVAITRWALMEYYGIVFAKVSSRIISNGRIGFAPINSLSYGEDIQAAKVPLQTFNWAITQVKIQLRDFEALHWIKFKFLPSQFYISSPTKAELFRRIFHLDILLWGSFASDGKNTIWLNIHQNLTNKRESDDELVSRSKHQLFPLTLDLDVPAISLAQAEPFDAYTVLLLVVILVLQTRWRKQEKRWFKNFDRLYYQALDRNEILTKLASETFLSLSDLHLPQSENDLPSAKQLLTETAGRWVGYQLTQDEPKKHVLDQLHSIAVKCTKVMPDIAEHYYRLGAIKCLQNDEDQTLEMFKKAKALEKFTLNIDPVREFAYAHVDLDQTNGSSSNARIALARFSAHAARALHLGDEYIHDRLDEELRELKKKTLDEAILESTAITVVKKMLKSVGRSDAVD